MDVCTHTDALTGNTVTWAWPAKQVVLSKTDKKEPVQCESVFLPGCTLINCGLPLVTLAYNHLREAGVVQGISFLCCGLILDYEENGAERHANYISTLRNRAIEIGLKRIVTVCPNCVQELRRVLRADDRTADIEVVPLPGVLADMGCRIDIQTARNMLLEELADGSMYYSVADEGVPKEADLKFCIHDSCPDRETGEFADGVRALMPPEITNETGHIRNRSVCCGTSLRMVGKEEAGAQLSMRCGQDALTACAQGIVTVCVSCVFQLSHAQSLVPAFHYLELLYGRRVHWALGDPLLNLRFLFDENLGVEVVSEKERLAFLEEMIAAED